MANNTYYSHLPSDTDLAAPQSTQSSPLKPMFLAGNQTVAQHDAEEGIAHVRQDDLVRIQPTKIPKKDTDKAVCYSN